MSELTYKKERRAFVVYNNEIVMQPKDSFCSMRDWVRENLPDADYDIILRGYVDSHGIYFVMGPNYLPVSAVPIDKIKAVASYWYSEVAHYNFCDLAVWTGMVVGPENTFWTPRILLGKVTPHLSFLPIQKEA